jgi:hypothetical protein
MNDLPRIQDYTRSKIARLLATQCADSTHRNGGGFLLDDSGYADSRGSIFEGFTLFVGYLYPEFSEWYAQPEMLERIRLLLGFMRRRQRANGTVMLGASASPGCCEIGFTLPGACAVYKRVLASDVPGKREILDTFGHYIRRGAEALRTLRPFTSNHRWTACIGPLALVDRVFPHPGNRAVIDDYLDDGLDLDADGLWHEERSPNYNTVSNWGMLYLADALSERRFLEAAARNLRLVLDLIQPCGEADTTFSHRQDRGQTGANWGDYYVCKRLAVEFGDGEFAQAADMQLARLDVGYTPFIPLRFLFDDRRFQEEDIPRQPLPEHVEIRFRESPLWHWREGQTAATVVADKGGHWWDVVYGRWGAPPRNNTLMSLHHGTAIIDGIKMLWGTGGCGFKPETILYEADGSLRMEGVDCGMDHVAHYRPKAKWDWTHLPFDQRAQLAIRRLPGNSFRLEGEIDGEPDCHVNVQLLLRETCRLLRTDGSELTLARGGRTFSDGGDYLLKGPDGSHLRIAGLPASECSIGLGDGPCIAGLAEQRCHRLICAGLTPFHFALSLMP